MSHLPGGCKTKQKVCLGGRSSGTACLSLEGAAEEDQDGARDLNYVNLSVDSSRTTLDLLAGQVCVSMITQQVKWWTSHKYRFTMVESFFK